MVWFKRCPAEMDWSHHRFDRPATELQGTASADLPLQRPGCDGQGLAPKPAARPTVSASAMEERVGLHEQNRPPQWQRRRATGHTADSFGFDAEEMKMKALFAALPFVIGLIAGPVQAQGINDVLRQVAPEVFGTQPQQQQQREDDRRTYQRDDRQYDQRRAGRRDDREDERYRSREERDDDRYRGRDTREDERRIRAREDRLGDRQRELDAERRRLSQERYR